MNCLVRVSVLQRYSKRIVLCWGVVGLDQGMGKPSTCAFRCFYDSENDVCGPSHFCEKVGSSPADNLAPFGSKQKCKAVGGPSHEAADRGIAQKLEDIKRDVLDLTEKLEQSPAISESDSSRSSVKEASALVQEANQMLNIMETFPMRLAPEAGDFPEAAARAAYTDMKHWRRRPDRLTIEQYKEAGSKSVSALRGSRSYSVPAKLHNSLVDFMKKRPHLLIRFLKHETNDQCVLSDETDSDRERLGTFVNYYMSVPGYNINDLKDVTLDLPAHCQDFLVSGEAADPESIVQTAGEGQQILSNSTSEGSEGGLLQVKSERLACALGPDGTSFLQSGTSADFAADESERAQEVLFIIGCIVVCLLCFFFATAFFMMGFASIAGCGNGGGCFAAYFVCMTIGSLIMRWPHPWASPRSLLQSSSSSGRGSTGQLLWRYGSTSSPSRRHRTGRPSPISPCEQSASAEDLPSTRCGNTVPVLAIGLYLLGTAPAAGRNKSAATRNARFRLHKAVYAEISESTLVPLSTKRYQRNPEVKRNPKVFRSYGPEGTPKHHSTKWEFPKIRGYL